MKKLIILFVVLATFSMKAKSLKILTDKVEKTIESAD